MLTFLGTGLFDPLGLHRVKACFFAYCIVAVCPIGMIDLTDTGKNKKKNLSGKNQGAAAITRVATVLQLIQPQD